MNLARWPRDNALEERLLWVRPRDGSWSDLRVGHLTQALRSGDLLVVNDSATLPASLSGHTADGSAVEVRLVGRAAGGAWRAVLFGPGDWRMRTEDRPAPPPIPDGARITFDDDLTAEVVGRSATSPRLIEVRFDKQGPSFWAALYRLGRPIQYSYVDRPLDLWHVQSGFAARPWSFEAPSASRPLRWELVLHALRQGVRIAAITHSAGVSSLGEATLDAQLPFREHYEVTPEAAQAVNRARAEGARVIAVGTTVVRALESSALSNGGRVAAGTAETNLIVTGFHKRLVADGILTGFHEPTSSHLQLLLSFISEDRLRASYAHAQAAGYLWHEFGDSMLILD